MRRWMPWCVFDIDWLHDEQAFIATCAAWPGNWALGATPEAAIAELMDVEHDRAEQVGVYRSCGCLWCDFNGVRGHHPGLLSNMTHRRTIRHHRFAARRAARHTTKGNHHGR